MGSFSSAIKLKRFRLELSHRNFLQNDKTANQLDDTNETIIIYEDSSSEIK